MVASRGLQQVVGIGNGDPERDPANGGRLQARVDGRDAKVVSGRRQTADQDPVVAKLPHRPGEIEDQRLRAVCIDRVGEIVAGAGRGRNREGPQRASVPIADGERRRRDGKSQGVQEILPIAEGVGDDEITKRIVIGNLEVERVLQVGSRHRVATAHHDDRFLDRKRLVVQNVIRSHGVRLGHRVVHAARVPRVQGRPVALSAGIVQRPRRDQIVFAVKGNDPVPVGVELGHVEIDDHPDVITAGAGDRRDGGHQRLAGEQETRRPERSGRDVGRRGDMRGRDVDARDDEVVVEPVDDVQIGHGLARGDADRQHILPRKIRAGRRLVLRAKVGLGHPDHRGRGGRGRGPSRAVGTCVDRVQEQRRIHRGVVQRVRAVLKTAPRRVGQSDSQIREIRKGRLQADRRRRLVGRERPKRQLGDHQHIPGRATDLQRRARAVHGIGMGNTADPEAIVRKRQLGGRHRLAQIRRSGNGPNPVRDVRTGGPVRAVAGKHNVNERAVTDVGRRGRRVVERRFDDQRRGADERIPGNVQRHRRLGREQLAGLERLQGQPATQGLADRLGLVTAQYRTISSLPNCHGRASSFKGLDSRETVPGLAASRTLRGQP